MSWAFALKTDEPFKSCVDSAVRVVVPLEIADEVTRKVSAYPFVTRSPADVGVARSVIFCVARDTEPVGTAIASNVDELW
jgi:hypothetical protein